MTTKNEALDPDMPASQIRLHMGELTADEVRVARAAIRWANSRNDTKKTEALRVVGEQAEDDGLWFVATRASEVYLQQELRRLHEAIEGKKADQCAITAIIGEG